MTQETTHSLVSADQKRSVSKGEKAFDFTVYGLMNWVGTLVITVPIAYWMMHGKGAGVTSIRNGVNKGFEFVMEPTLKAVDWVLSPIRKVPTTPMKDRVKWWSEQNTITFATMQGGNLMVLPIWLAERGKVPLVDGANKMLGDDTDRATIAEVPKTDIWSLTKARLAAFTTVFVTFTTLSHLIPKTFRSFSEEFGTKAARWFKKEPYEDMQKATDWLLERDKLELKGDVFEDGVSKLKKLGENLGEIETKHFRLGKIASWDVVATTAAVVLLYTTSKFFSEEKDKKAHAKAARHDETNERKQSQSGGVSRPERESVPASEGFSDRLAEEKHAMVQEPNYVR